LVREEPSCPWSTSAISLPRARSQTRIAADLSASGRDTKSTRHFQSTGKFAVLFPMNGRHYRYRFAAPGKNSGPDQQDSNRPNESGCNGVTHVPHRGLFSKKFSARSYARRY
jgi:hypothetical protein